jgi:hypothetical protein
MTTPDEPRKKAEAIARALYDWAQRHLAAPDAPLCPVCAGVKWVFRVQPVNGYVPRVCTSCGYVLWFDAALLGVAGVELPQAGDGRESPHGEGRAGP